MENVRNNFLIQVLHGTTKDDTQMELPFTNDEELADNDITNGRFGCSHHEVNCEDLAVSEEDKNIDS